MKQKKKIVKKKEKKKKKTEKEQEKLRENICKIKVKQGQINQCRSLDINCDF